MGGKCSAADLSFVPFHSRLAAIMGDDKPDMEREFSNVDKWYRRMLERGAVKKVLGERDGAYEEIAARRIAIPGVGKGEKK